jgi:hypothetical protein
LALRTAGMEPLWTGRPWLPNAPREVQAPSGVPRIQWFYHMVRHEQHQGSRVEPVVLSETIVHGPVVVRGLFGVAATSRRQGGWRLISAVATLRQRNLSVSR